MKIKYILFFVLLSPSFYTLNAKKNNQGPEKFNWQNYDNRSSVIKDSINYNLLQGNWMSQTERCILAKYNYDYYIMIKSK